MADGLHTGVSSSRAFDAEDSPPQPIPARAASGAPRAAIYRTTSEVEGNIRAAIYRTYTADLALPWKLPSEDVGGVLSQHGFPAQHRDATMHRWSYAIWSLILRPGLGLLFGMPFSKPVAGWSRLVAFLIASSNMYHGVFQRWMYARRIPDFILDHYRTGLAAEGPRRNRVVHSIRSGSIQHIEDVCAAAGLPVTHRCEF